VLDTSDPFAPTLLTESRFHTALAAKYRVQGEKDDTGVRADRLAG
jgi:hypothetical protein